MADRDALNDEYVRLAVRPHDRPNLFARLPRRVVRQLLRLAAPAPAGDDTPEDVEDTEFLVLEVKHEDGSLVFLSFNGGFLDEDDGGDGSRSNGTLSPPRCAVHCIPTALAHDESVINCHYH